MKPRWAQLAIRLVVLVGALAAMSAWPGFAHSHRNDDPPDSIGKPPKATMSEEVETFHGVSVPDPYRWLEDGKGEEAQQFVQAQNAYTRSVLNRLPMREQISNRLDQLLRMRPPGVPENAGDYYFITRRGAAEQPVLYVRKGAEGVDHVLVNVNQTAIDGSVALDWWYPSHDGKYVAYGTSQNGTEMSTLHVIETETGNVLADTIDRTRWTEVAWKFDNSGFYYLRFPAKGEVPEAQEAYDRRLLYHGLGTDPAQDRLIFDAGAKPEDWLAMNVSDDGHWLLLGIFGNNKGRTRHDWYQKDLAADMPLLPLHPSPPALELLNRHSFAWGEIYQGNLYVVAANGMFVTPVSSDGHATWHEIKVGDARDASIWSSYLTGFKFIGGKLFVSYESQADSSLRVYSLKGKLEYQIHFNSPGSYSTPQGNLDGKEAFYVFQSFLVPPTIFRYEVATRQNTQWGPMDHMPVNQDDFAVSQFGYKVKDSTVIPIFVVAKKDVPLNGHNPTILYGYGAFGISLTPEFRESVLLWLEHGGVYVQANIRGGGEYGREWHQNGMLGKKQNSFDDFAAAAQFLFEKKYTDPDHLAIWGGSAGGLLIGAEITQHPEMFKAAICSRPVLDMLHYQNYMSGKMYIDEFGSVDDSKQFNWLYAYSPYHHVKAGVQYPATLLVTADGDTRANPADAKKMAALLQARASNGLDRPILLRVEPKAGHGPGTPHSKWHAELTDIYTFLFWQLGVK